MSVDIIDVTGQPRPARDIEAALRFVEAEIIINPTRMGPRDTGPAVIHYMTIRDALREVLALREQQTKRSEADEMLLRKLGELPPMTDDERIAQGLDFAYGNLASSTNHKPVRDVFKKLALDKGWSEAQFDTWAKDRTWRSTYNETIDRIARALKERLSKEEYADLRDILGDYRTDEWFCKKLRELEGSEQGR